MLEPEGFVARKLRPIGKDEIATNKLTEVAAEVRPVVLGTDLRESAPPKSLASDRGPLDHPALPRPKAVEPGAEQGAYCRRHLQRARRRGAGAIEHCGELFDE